MIGGNLPDRHPFVHAAASERSVLVLLRPRSRFPCRVAPQNALVLRGLGLFPVDVVMPVWQVRSAGGGVFGLPCGGKVMIKSELVARLAERYPHLYHRDVERIVSTVLDEISSALSNGDRVELRGFGAFSVKVRPARQGRNPRTGEAVSAQGHTL